MKYVVCYSGGHSSALCAIEAVRKHGKENVILLNHDISIQVEDADIKRFKNEVAKYLDLEITYANHDRWDTATPIDICVELGGWKFNNSPVLCTYHLKTKPFYDWLKKNDQDKQNIYIYGFDKTKSELVRMQRRSQKMGIDGYKTEFPLIQWDRTIKSTKEVGIEPPLDYSKFNHANCKGCLKAGWQHWYIIYCEHRDLWEKAKEAEEEIGFAIHKDNDGAVFLEDKEEFFEEMRLAGVVATEKVNPTRFWLNAKEFVMLKKLEMPIEQFDFFANHDNSVCLECVI